MRSIMLKSFILVSLVLFTIKSANAVHTIIIDGRNDFPSEALVAVDPTGDMTEPNLDLDSLWVIDDENYWYIGFNAYATDWGVTYGIYLFTDEIVASGATQDPWNRAVNVDTTSNNTGPYFYPPYALYIWHKEGGGVEDAQLCTWDENQWNYPTLISLNGAQGYNETNHFLEYAIPKNIFGHNTDPSVNSIFLEVFTAGGDNTHAQDTTPSDPNVNFTEPDWTSITTSLSSFVEVEEDHPTLLPGTSLGKIKAQFLLKK